MSPDPQAEPRERRARLLTQPHEDGGPQLSDGDAPPRILLVLARQPGGRGGDTGTPGQRISQRIIDAEPGTVDITCAGSAAEAQAMLHGPHAFYAAVLDLEAAGHHGAHLLDALRQAAPNVPLAVLVGSCAQGRAALARGAHAFLRKRHLDRTGIPGILDIAHMAAEMHRTRKELAEAREQLIHADRLASLGQLTAGVAHEINNPTAFLLANLEAMKDRLSGAQGADQASRPAGDHLEVAARLRELAEIVDESIEGIGQLRNIVKDLRSFSRVEEDEIAPVDLHRVLEVACKLAQNTITSHARLHKDLRPVPPIMANHGKLVQVFVNLLINAAHAISEGTPDENEIRVSTHVRGGIAIAAVEDTGCGIPEDARKLVFQPFFTTKPKDVGNGLGLSLSAEIIRNHGGELTFEPRSQRGTRFEVRLATTRAGGTVSARAPRRAKDVGRWRARVLLVDDEPGMLRAYRRVLAPRHEVVMAAGGQQALDILARDTDFDAVICDFLMPGVDGIAVHETLSLKDPELASRIVFCTGGAVTHRERDFIRSTSNTVLEKPVSPEFLLGSIEQLSSRC